MDEQETQEICRKLMEKYGLKSQLGQLMEECAELTQAAHKVIRYGNQRAIISLVEEIADVEIMIQQLKVGAMHLKIGKLVDEAKQIKIRKIQEKLL